MANYGRDYTFWDRDYGSGRTGGRRGAGDFRSGGSFGGRDSARGGYGMDYPGGRLPWSQGPGFPGGFDRSRGSGGGRNRYGGAYTPPPHRAPWNAQRRGGYHRGEYTGAGREYDEGFLGRLHDGWNEVKRGARRFFRNGYDGRG